MSSKNIANAAINELRFLFQTSFWNTYDPKQGWKIHFQLFVFLKKLAHSLLGIIHKERLVFPIIIHEKTARIRPKIVHIIGKIGGIGGSQKIIFDLMSNLNDMFDMEIVSLSDEMLFGYPFHAVYCLKPGKELSHYLEKTNPDLIHLHYYGDWYGFHEALQIVLKIPIKTKIIENVNTPIPAYYHPRINEYVYVSDFVKNLRSQPFGRTIYPGVDTDEYRPTQITSPKKTVGFVYRLFNDKLDQTSIECLIQIARLDPEAKIMVVGYGALFSKYFRQISEAGVRNHFTFCGRIPYESLPKLYRQFSLFVAPVVRESYGLVVPYAMAMNLPVIALRTDALPEILGDTNFLCDSPEEFARTTVWALNHPQEAQKQATNGRDRVQKYFSLKKMLEDYRHLYIEVLQNDV